MNHTIPALSIVLLLVIAGCQAPTVPHFGASPTLAPCEQIRPEPADANESSTYPKAPSNLDEKSVTTYVERFEETYWENHLHAEFDNLSDMGVNVHNVSVLQRSDDTSLVHADVEYSYMFDTTAGDGGYGVNYLVTDGRTYRIRTGYRDSGADPRNGFIVACHD